MLHSYRQSFRVSGAKDDRTDAILLEEYLRLHAPKLRPLWPDTTLTRKLACSWMNAPAWSTPSTAS
jgi:hypothetical protein